MQRLYSRSFLGESSLGAAAGGFLVAAALAVRSAVAGSLGGLAGAFASWKEVEFKN